MSNQILVARPNAFIVKNMRQLLQDCGKQPVILNEIGELNRYKSMSFSGIVISTAVSSTINASFEEVLSLVLESFGKTPILLPTLLDSDRAKKTIGLSLNGSNSSYELTSVSDVLNGKLLESDKLLIIEKKDIVNSKNYSGVVDLLKNFFGTIT